MQRSVSLSTSLIDTVCALIEQGHSPFQAALASGVSESTWSRWLRRGRGYERPPSPECEELVSRVDDAAELAREARGIQHTFEREQSHQQVVAKLHYKIRMLEQENVRLRSGVCQHRSVQQPAPMQRSTIRVKSRRHRRWG